MQLSQADTRAGIYARVSSEKQAQAGTIGSQVAALRERVQRDGFLLDEEMCFIDDGYSGTVLVRPALERLRDVAASGGLDRLYVHSPDRLSRKFAYQCLLLEEWQRAGVEVVFLNRPLGQTPEDDLLLQVQGVVAEYERAKILERNRRGKRHAAHQGAVHVFGRAPYGYRYVSKQEGGGQGRYDILEEEAQVVQQIFTWVGQERWSLHEVARRLTEQQQSTRSGKKRWNPRTVWGILINKAYQGMAQFGKTRVVPRQQPLLRPWRGHPEHSRWQHSVATTPEQERINIPVPALVSQELFAAAEEQLAENKKRARASQRGARFLLQGLLVCSGCGYAWCGRSGTRKVASGQRGYSYYQCSTRNVCRFGEQRDKTCAIRPLRVDRLDAAVWSDVRALLTDPGKIEEEYRRRLEAPQATKLVTSAEALAKRMAQAKRGIARLIDGYENGLLDKEEFEPRIRNAKERLAHMEKEAQEQANLEAQEQELRLVVGCFQEFAARVQEGLEGADWQTQRGIIRALVKRVEIGEDLIRLVYRVDCRPFVNAPKEGFSHDCLRRSVNRLAKIVERLAN